MKKYQEIIAKTARILGISLMLMSLFHALSAQAQMPIDEKAIMTIVDSSIQEYRVYATCSSLDEMTLSLVKDMWNKSKNEALRDLKSDGASVIFLAKFALATHESKILDSEMKLAEAMPYCYKNKKQVQRFYEYGQSDLAQEIYKLQKKSK